MCVCVTNYVRDISLYVKNDWYFPKCFFGFCGISGRFLPMSFWQTLPEYISEPTSHWNEPSSKMAFWVLCSRCLAQFGTVQTPGMCGKLGHTGKG